MDARDRSGPRVHTADSHIANSKLIPAEGGVVFYRWRILKASFSEEKVWLLPVIQQRNKQR